MKRILTVILIVFGSFSLMGCDTMSHEDAGTLTGAVAGGLVGSTIGGGGGKMLAIAAGALAGGMIGNSIGRHMDATDIRRMNSALENNPIGEPAYWRNERYGVDYEVVPVRNVSVQGNSYCREYRTVAWIGGKKQQVFGTACRQPDGAWRVVS